MTHFPRIFVRLMLMSILMPSTAVSFAADSAAQSSASVKVMNAVVRPPLPGQTVAGGYMELTSTQDAAVVAVGSPIAGRTELHTTAMEGNVMRMRPLEKLDLKAGETVRLVPGGAHLMFFDVKRPLKQGERIPITLSIQPAGAASGTALTTVTFEAEVRPLVSKGHQH